MPIKIRIIIAFLLFAFFSSGQVPSQIIFSRVTKKDGLASNSTFQTVRDKQGFLWIATQNGLQRYDGNRFITFRHMPGNLSSMPLNNVNHLYIDSSERLWVLFAKQIGIFNTVDFRFREIRIDAPVSSIKKLMEDTEGRIVLFADSKQFVYDESKNLFVSAYPLPVLPAGYTVGDMAIDRPNGSYLFTGKQGSLLYDPKTKQFASQELRNKDEALDSFVSVKNARYPFIEKNGSWWMVSWIPFSGSAPVLFNYDKSRHQLLRFEKIRAFKSADSYYEIWNIFQQRNGTIWIYGMGLLAYYNSEGKNFVIINSDPFQQNGIEYDFVSNLFEDEENNVWVCTNKGLYRFNVEAQVFRNIPNKRLNDTTPIRQPVSNIIQTQNNGIWVSTWGAGIFSYNDQLEPIPNPVTTCDPQNKGLHAGTMIQRRNGEVWIGTYTGELKIYDPASGKCFSVMPPSLRGTTITQLVEDHSNNIWIGTTSGLLMKCTSGNWKDTGQTFKPVLSDAGDVMNLYVDNNNHVWVCSATNGLYEIDSKDGGVVNQFKGNVGKNQGLLNDGATDILQYNDSIFLIASDGLCILNNKRKTFSYLTASDGLPVEHITNLICDKEKRLWVALDGGLYRLNINSKLHVSYDEADGITNDIFQVSSAAVLTDGRIAIGTPKNFMVFDPEKTIDRNEVPQVNITGFILGTTHLPVDSLQKLDRVRLSHDNTFLNIELSTLSFRDQYYMYYMLDGLDKSWKRVYNNEITYQYLPPGNYTLKLKSQNGEGIESKNVTMLRIQVAPPFWKAWWFYSLLVLLLAGLLFWLDNERIKRKTAILRMRSNIADDLHEDINAALSNITILSEMAKIKADKEPEKSKEFIEQIHTKSRNMTMAMDDILWSIDPNNDSMDNFLLRFREYMDALKTLHNVQIDLRADRKVTQVQLKLEIRNHVFWLFKKVITTAVAEGGENCRVHVTYEKPVLVYRLIFDSAKIDLQQLKNMFEEPELLDKVDRLNAKLDSDEINSKTEVVLSIPIKKF